MSLEEIYELMEQLENLQASVEVHRMNKQKLIDQILTPETKAALEEVDAEFQELEDEANKAIAKAGAKLKQAVSIFGESVKHGGIHAVYTKGRVTWNNQGLDRYAKEHPEIMHFRKEGEPSVSIRVAQ